jgi:hypothetical protein
VHVIVPDDADEAEISNILEQALVLALDYQPTDTTLGTDNISLNIYFLSQFIDPEYRMRFTYSELQAALEDGLEGEALLEALGGVIALD